MKPTAFEQPPSTPPRPEMSPDEIRRVVDLWTTAVLGSDEKETATSEGSLREMIASSLKEQTAELIDEWGLAPDEELLARVRAETDPKEKARLQEKFIRQASERIQKFVGYFDRSKPRSTKWDSWPLRMKERREFNCVGAALIGTVILERAGIETFVGNPPSHVVNVVKLADGKWWYADFMNGTSQVRPIAPQESELSSTRVLRLREPAIDYRLVPIYPAEGLPIFVLENFASIQRSAQDDAKDIETEAAREYVSRFADSFGQTDLDGLSDRLFPNARDIQNTDEMRLERQRIERLYADDDVVRQAIGALSPEEQKTLVAELAKNIQAVRNFFMQKNAALPAGIGESTGRFLTVYRESFERIAEGNREEYERLVEGRLARIDAAGAR